MKIVHLCLSCFYIDGFSYQENELVRQNVRDGHEVLVVASTESFDSAGQVTYVSPRDYDGTDGARVIRLPYRRWLPARLMRKVRSHPGVLDILIRERPDVILFHGLCGWELLTVKAYKEKCPAVKVFADSHEDFNNSARSALSRHLLHGVYYRRVLDHALAAIEKVLCVSIETIAFVRDFYGVPASKIEFYPLGGFVYADDAYDRIRSAARSQYEINDETILFVQSGKMDAKKKVLESLTAFRAIDQPNVSFILAGNLHESISTAAMAMIEADPRIRFVGWKSAEELRRLLCAADVYVQPGTQSATMQMSLCARCAVILDDVASHEPYVRDNGWLVGQKTSLSDALRAAAAGGERLKAMSRQSARIADDLLDYRKLAARLYE